MNNQDHDQQTDPEESSQNSSSMLDDSNVKIPPRRRGIYLLPNLFTTGALFFGFYAIVSAMNNLFDQAAIAIFIAMILDGVDGRVARLTNTQSVFGAEYDSLSDMVAFGAAPALVVFTWALSDLGKVGWVVSFVYTACTALRLARFNTQLDTMDKAYFIGLPCPSAAAIVASFVWVMTELGFHPIDNFLVLVSAVIITAGAGILMVTNIRYPSFKDFDVKGKVPYIASIALVMVFAVIFLDPPKVLFLGFFLFILSGPVQSFIRFVRTKKQKA